MARNPGGGPAPSQPPGPPADRSTGPPAARRPRASGWRDPRLWIGVAIVAVSVVGGARLLAAVDDTVTVWATTSDLGPGDRVDDGDLVAHRVRFADADHLAGYFTADEELPADLQLTRSVGAGELLPRSAVGSASEAGTVELPVAVDVALVPPSVGPGSVVDVHLVASGRRGPDGPALSAVTVVDAPRLDDGFGPSGRRQLVLAVDEADADAFFELLGSVDDPVLTVVRRS